MNDIRAQIDASPMSSAQVTAVGLTVLLSALDGYDILSVTFAAPAITAAWGIGKAALGVVLSAGLVGMALGSFLIAPFADTFGRKPLIIVSLSLMAIGMLLSAFAHDLPSLAAWRVVTGLGIGTCAAVINPLAAEFANARRRALTVAMMTVGYPAGGLVGGLLAALLLRVYDWPAVFFAGFVAALILIPVVIRFMPESIVFLLQGRRADSLERVNAVLERCGQASIDSLPEQGHVAKRGYAAIFAPDQIGATLWITGVNFLFVIAFYFLLSWLPQMVADAGFDASTASRVSAVTSLAGICGGLIVGWLAQKGGLRWLTGCAMIGLGLAIAVFGLVPPSFPLIVLTAGICGLFLFGGAAGGYATMATTFTDAARAAGSGFVIGVGRVSSAIAPLLAGWMFASELGPGVVSAAFGACSAVAGLLLIFGWNRFRLV